MTLYLPNGLPIASDLRQEGYEVGALEAAPAGALHLVLVNLMPLKEATELAFARLLAQTGRAIAVHLVVPGRYQPQNTAPSHLDAHYRRWPEIRDGRCDALIVTGAPVETMPFPSVAYWPEIEDIVRSAQARAVPSLYVCWAAQAALHILHGLPKTALPEKAFGVFEQSVLAPSELLRGMGSLFPVPVSRHTEVDREALARSGLAVLAGSAETGASIVEDRQRRAVFVFDHLEYARETLMLEYERDRRRGLPTAPPRQASSGHAWQPYAALFFRNWLDAASAARPAADEEPFAWLFDGSSAARRQGAAEMILQVEPHPHLLSDVLARLARVGAEPIHARVQSRGGGSCRVGIRIEPGTVAHLEGAVETLLAMAGARRLLVRLPDGSGGVYRPLRQAALARAA